MLDQALPTMGLLRERGVLTDSVPSHPILVSGSPAGESPAGVQHENLLQASNTPVHCGSLTKVS